MQVVEMFLETFARFAEKLCDCRDSATRGAAGPDFHTEECVYRKTLEGRE